MELTSNHPFWFVKDGLPATYPFLTHDVMCDVAIVGGGVTGSMIASRLSRLGMSVVVLDRRDVCTGSTSASTALLQYEIDVPLTKMIKMIGKDDAERAYRISHRSVDELTNLMESVDGDCEFERKLSIYLADNNAAAIDLVQEYRARKAIGLDVAYCDENEIESQFGIKGKAALTSRQAASCNPYRLAHALLRDATERGAKIFDRTEVSNFVHEGNLNRIYTNREAVVTCKDVIIATGYESSQMLPGRVVNLDNTYALVSQPLTENPDEAIGGWNKQWMLWEAKNPYLYLRITKDHRLLVGGEDDPCHSPAARDAKLGAKAKAIEAKVRKLIPDLRWEREFAWAGTFGKTADGLAYIGIHPKFPNRYFALGFGGNGITFSQIATEIIADMVRGIDNPDAYLFRFNR